MHPLRFPARVIAEWSSPTNSSVLLFSPLRWPLIPDFQGTQATSDSCLTVWHPLSAGRDSRRPRRGGSGQYIKQLHGPALNWSNHTTLWVSKWKFIYFTLFYLNLYSIAQPVEKLVTIVFRVQLFILSDINRYICCWLPQSKTATITVKVEWVLEKNLCLNESNPRSCICKVLQTQRLCR